jgi:hypothetical protein
MSMRLAVFAALSATVVLGLAACGGGGGESKDTDANSEGAKVACDGSPIQTTQLPAGFPKPDGVTYTKTSKAGPSHVVDGYYEGEVKDAYPAYKDAFESAGYKVLFNEIEDNNDSEVSYDGEGRTGQVALRNECEESGRITVHITSRPE